MIFSDLVSTIKKLNKEEKYQEALQLFEKHKASFPNEEIAENAVLVIEMLTTLRHSGHLDAALRFVDIYPTPITAETETLLLGAYGWVIHSILKKEVAANRTAPEEGTTDEALADHTAPDETNISTRALEFLKLVNTREDNYLRTVESFIFQHLLKYEESRADVNWQIILEVCELFTAERLSDKCGRIKVSKKGGMVDKELPSERENWYAAKSKAQLELGQFAECSALCMEALERIEQLHNHNQLWFIQRISQAAKSLGQIDEGITDLQKILVARQVTTIHKELAELHAEKGDYAKAIEHCKKGFDGTKDVGSKVRLLQLSASCHFKMGHQEQGYKYLQLAKLVWEAKGGKLPLSLEQDLIDIPKEISTIQDKEALLAELHFVVRSNEAPSGTRLSGIVENILHNNDQGIDGFIKADRDSYYFMIRRSDPMAALIIRGKEFSFEVGEDNKGRQVALQLKENRGRQLKVSLKTGNK